jgi:hypothetical protein
MYVQVIIWGCAPITRTRCVVAVHSPLTTQLVVNYNPPRHAAWCPVDAIDLKQQHVSIRRRDHSAAASSHSAQHESGLDMALLCSRLNQAPLVASKATLLQLQDRKMCAVPKDAPQSVPSGA